MQVGRVCDICPFLLPSTPLGQCYRGYITVDDVDFALRLTLPPGGELSNARLECDWRLSQLLIGKEALVQKFLQESQDVASFLLKFKNMLEHIHKTQPSTALLPPPPPTHYCQLLADLDQIGWERVVHISADFTQLQIRTQDKKQREHILTIHTTQQAKNPPTISCNLPLAFKPSWTEQTTLTEVVEQFEDRLCHHQQFWDVMDELDRKTWVLEPENPTPACNYRRIVIGTNASLHLTIDPRRPSGLPEFKFLGPEHVVGPIRLNMMARITQWDARVHVSVIENLENLLALKLPPPETSQEGFSGECGICYAYRLDGVAPEMVCNNQHCTQPFHLACLFEWLNTLPTTRQSFGTLFGECPYCNEKLSIKLHGS